MFFTFFNLEFGTSSVCCSIFMVGQHPRWSLVRSLATLVATIEALKREPQLEELTGAIATPTPTAHRTSYLGGGASDIIMAAASPMFRPARSGKYHEHLTNEPKNAGYARDLDISASPLLFRTCPMRAPSALPRYPERDTFLLCATKKKKNVGGAYATTQTFAMV